MSEGLPAEVMALIESGARTFVTAMSSDTWWTLRVRFARLLRTQEAALDETRQQYLSTAAPERPAVDGWYVATTTERLKELVQQDASVAGELSALLNELYPGAAPAAPPWGAPAAAQYGAAYPATQQAAYGYPYPDGGLPQPKRQSFLGLPPGVLIGLAVLIAAVAGIGAYFGTRGGSNTPTRTASSTTTAPPGAGDTPSAASTPTTGNTPGGTDTAGIGTDPACLSAESAFRSMLDRLQTDESKLTADAGDATALQGDLATFTNDIQDIKTVLDSSMAQAQHQSVKDAVQKMDTDVGTVLAGLKAIQSGDSSKLNQFQAAAGRLGTDGDALDALCSTP